MSYPPKFEDIATWQLAWELTRKVYGLTKKAKFTRDFGLKALGDNYFSEYSEPRTSSASEQLNAEPI